MRIHVPSHGGRCVVLASCIGLLAAAHPGAQAIRLSLSAVTSPVVSGREVEIRVELRDLGGEPAKAMRPFEVRLSAGDETLPSVTIGAGEAGATTRFVPRRPGILEIRAAHDEALPGSVLLRVAPEGGWLRAAATGLKPPIHAAPPLVDKAMPPAKPKPAHPGGVIVTAPAPLPPPPASASSSAPTPIALRATPSGEVLANGRDAAQIYAFVTADVLPSRPIDLTLVPSAGRLDPMRVRIPAGAPEGRAALTSDLPRVVDVQWVSAQPAVTIQGDAVVHVSFVPAVERLTIQLDSDMTLVERGRITARLENAAGTPVATHRARPVRFSVARGSASLPVDQVEIPAGQFDARVDFTPLQPGTLEIAAATDGLPTTSGTVRVRTPALLLGLAGAGGAAGGLVAIWRSRAKRRWLRPLVGIVTGFFVYWAALFGLLDKLPHDVAVNPLSAIAIAILGGWLGTEVFGAIAKRLGLRV